MLHQVGDLFELNVKLQCQKVNEGQNIVMLHDDIMTVDCGNHTKRVNTLWR
jgi:hypothetical protein